MVGDQVLWGLMANIPVLFMRQIDHLSDQIVVDFGGTLFLSRWELFPLLGFRRNIFQLFIIILDFFSLLFLPSIAVLLLHQALLQREEFTFAYVLMGMSFIKISLNQLDLWYFLLPVFYLLQFLLYYQVKPVFEGVFCPSVEQLHDFCPLLHPIQILNCFEKEGIFCFTPWSFLEVWVQVAIPVLSALFGTPIYFVGKIVFFVEFFWHGAPVLSAIFSKIW